MLPRFSLRFALLALTLAAAFSLVISAAVRGELWAAAVVIGVGSVALTLIVHGFYYAFTWTVGAVVSPAAKPPQPSTGE